MNMKTIALALAAIVAAGEHGFARASEVPPGEPAVRVSQIAVTNPTGAGVDVDVTADYPLYEDVVLVHTNVTREVKPGGGYQWKTNIWRTVERRKTGYSVPRTPIASFTAGPGLTVVSNVAAKVDIMEGMRVFADISDPRAVAQLSYAEVTTGGGATDVAEWARESYTGAVTTAIGAVPVERTVAGKALTGDVTLSSLTISLPDGSTVTYDGSDGKSITIPEGTTVSVTPVLTTGTKSATVTVNGTPTDIYAPAAVTDEHIEEVSESKRMESPYLEKGADGGVYVVIPE